MLDHELMAEAKRLGLTLVQQRKAEHPILPALSVKLLRRFIGENGLVKGTDAWNQLAARRNEMLIREETDPLHHGYEPPSWKLADYLWGWISAEECLDTMKSVRGFPGEERIKQWQEFVRSGVAAKPSKDFLLLGGNRSTKTTYMCKRAVQCAVKYPSANIWMFHESLPVSIETHQAIMYEFLPQEWKDVGQTSVGYVSYSLKNGFTGESFVGPNKSRVSYKTYGANPKTFEGPSLGEPERRPCIACGADELIPLPLVKTLAYRTVTRRGVFLRAFTPIRGYSGPVSTVVKGAKTLVEMKSCVEVDKKPKVVPIVVENRVMWGEIESLSRAMWFASEWNPFSDFKDLKAKAARESTDVQLIRLYGYAERSETALFPKWNRAVHVVKAEVANAVEGTTYMVLDPAGHRQWSMIWARVDRYGRIWIWREWPCSRHAIPGHGYPGPWAEEGEDAERGQTLGGKAGRGQTPGLGLTLWDYKAEIARIEGWTDLEKDDKTLEAMDAGNGAKIPVELRLLDSRAAATPSYARTEHANLLEVLADANLICEPTEVVGRDQTQGWQLINDALGHLPEWSNPAEGPQIFISEDCENVIFALENFTGLGGPKEASKDFVDLLRYLLHAQPYYIEPTAGDLKPADFLGSLLRKRKAQNSV